MKTILAGTTSSSMKSHVLLLQKEALGAVADKHIYQQMNQEIVKKKQPKKQSCQFFETCRILDKELADKMCKIEQEKQDLLQQKQLDKQTKQLDKKAK